MKAKKVSQKFLWVSLFCVCLSLIAILPTALSADNPPQGWLTKNFTFMTFNISDDARTPVYHYGIYSFLSSTKEVYKNQEYPLSLINIQEDWESHVFDLAINNTLSKYFIHPTVETGLNLWGDGLAVFSDFKISDNTRHIGWKYENNWDLLAKKGFVFSVITIPVTENSSFVIHFYNLHANAGGPSGSRNVINCKPPALPTLPNFKDIRELQMCQLKDYMNLHSSGMPVIISGDFNIHGMNYAEWGDYYIMEGLLRDQKLLMANERNVPTNTDKTETWDYILYRSGDDNRIKLTSNEYLVCSDNGSDHLPVWAKFSYSMNYDAFPDLCVTDIQLDSTNADIVKATIKNNGPAAVTSPFSVRMDAYGKKNYKSVDVPLVSGETVEVSIYYKDPPEREKIFTTITIDEHDDIKENNESNNSLGKDIERPFIRVTAPNGGESWACGITHNISWTSTSYVNYVKIELLKAGVPVTSNLPTSLAASLGSYSWTIPTNIAFSNNYKIRISDSTNLSVTDSSDASFSIVKKTPTITVTSPNGGESWNCGSTYTIQWTSNNVANVKIELLKGGFLVTTPTNLPSSLAASLGSYSWTIPTNLTPGSDYKIRISDSANPSVFDKSNVNFSIFNKLPDVVITKIWLVPANPLPGQKVYVKATIKNQGTVATPSGIVVAVGFKVDGNILGAFFVRTNGVDRPLAAGKSYSAACEAQWTATAGTHTVWVIADDVNRFPESNENNNVMEKSFPIANKFPDVVITNIWLDPANPLPGQQVNIYATITNQGAVATPSGIVIAVGFKVDGNILGAFFVRTNGADRPLAAGESYSAACEAQWTATAGTHTVRVIADDVNRFPESDENNNVRESTFTIQENPQLPDVVITNIWLDPANPLPGQQVNIYATITNQGAVATPSGIVIAVGFKVDGNILGAFFVRTNGVDRPLAAGESYSAACEAQWTATAGTHTARVIADDVNRFPESNENNNVRESTFTIQENSLLPDVVITDIWLVPFNPLPDQRIYIYATIKNQGKVATPSGIVVSAGFSVDGNILGSFFVRTNWVDRPLAAGESYSAACEAEWTATLGTHTVRVMADDVNRFPESDENNNIMEQSFTIQENPQLP